MRADEFDLTICLLGMNGREMTLACLRSIFDHPDGLTREVIYLDNGSTDGAVAAVREQFPEVIVKPMGENLGFPVPYNQAFRDMRGRYGLVLNNDTLMTEGALGTAVRYLDEHEEVGLLGANLLNRDGSRQNAIHNFPTLLAEVVPSSILKILFPRHFPSRRVELVEPTDVECVLGAFIMFRRDLLDEVGGLDERFFIYLEETDWCLRAHEKGYKVVHHPDVRVFHLHGVTTGQVRVAGRIEFTRSKYKYFRKHRGSLVAANVVLVTVIRLMWCWLSTFFVVLVTCGQYSKMRGKLRQYSYLLLWHLKGMPSSWGLRTGRPDSWDRGTIEGWQDGVPDACRCQPATVGSTPGSAPGSAPVESDTGPIRRS